MIFRSVLISLLCLVLLVFSWSAVQAAPETLHHDLQVRMTGVDRIRVNPNRAERLSFNLSKKIHVSKVTVNSVSVSYDSQHGSLHIPLKPDQRDNIVTVSIAYEGVFDDPIPESPVNTDDPSYGVTAVISERGSFFQAGSGWYPEMSEDQPTYRLRVDAPEGVLSVSVGRCLGHETKRGRTFSVWEVKHPVEGLPLSAARYVVREKTEGNAKAATYFFPGTMHLAEGYLNATIRYLVLYEKLFGPYPFDRFAVVENFFPTGYGFPSYTLLGSRVIRLPFIIHTSLGHEIAHCWWGNGVYADYDTGNWSEGLTTYIADYLYKERASHEKARQYRLQILRKFSTLTRPEGDFPLRQFQSRYDPASQAIGYGKGAMVFHMLRRQLGDDAFWEALRDVRRERLFQKTSWIDFQRAFERHCQCSLERYFEQWLSRKGAPQLSLERIRSTRTGNTWEVKGTIVQKRPLYVLQLGLTITSGRQKVTEKIKVSEKETPFQIMSKGKPERLSLDPDFDIFRQLYPSEIPPSINAIKGSSSVRVVIARTWHRGLEEAAKTLTLSLGLKNFEIVPESQLPESALLENDLLFLGLPQKTQLLSRLPPQVTLRQSDFELNGKRYTHPSLTFFGVFAHPMAEGRVVALFLPLSKAYLGQVARKVTHYGKYSYLVFSQGRNQVKGMWPTSKSPLIYEWERHQGMTEKRSY
jgi:hypothetical protein